MVNGANGVLSEGIKAQSSSNKTLQTAAGKRYCKSKIPLHTLYSGKTYYHSNFADGS